jgi:hypothetical protein
MMTNASCTYRECFPRRAYQAVNNINLSRSLRQSEHGISLKRHNMTNYEISLLHGVAFSTVCVHVPRRRRRRRTEKEFFSPRRETSTGGRRRGRRRKVVEPIKEVRRDARASSSSEMSFKMLSNVHQRGTRIITNKQSGKTAQSSVSL